MVDVAGKAPAGAPMVLWVVDHLAHDGAMHGAAHYKLAVIPRIDPHRFRVKLCVMRGDAAVVRRFREAGIDVEVLDRSKFDFRAVVDVVRLARSSDARILHCHGYGSTNFGRLASLMCKATVLIHQHDDGFSYPWYQRVADAVLRPTCRRVIAVSENVADAVVSKMGYQRENVEVLANGIDLGKFAPERHSAAAVRAGLGIDSDELVIGAVARLRSEKGIDRAIRALSLVVKSWPKARLLLVGDGPDREALEKLAITLGVADRVTFLGQREDIPQLLAAMDVFILPSRTEGCSLAVVEALAMGKAIVASDLPATRAQIRDRVNGRLVDQEVPGAFADAILELARDPDLRRQLSQAARERAQDFGVVAHVDRLQQIYSQSLAGIRGRVPQQKPT